MRYKSQENAVFIAIHPTTYRSGGFLAHGVLKPPFPFSPVFLSAPHTALISLRWVEADYLQVCLLAYRCCALHSIPLHHKLVTPPYVPNNSSNTYSTICCYHSRPTVHSVSSSPNSSRNACAKAQS